MCCTPSPFAEKNLQMSFLCQKWFKFSNLFKRLVLGVPPPQNRSRCAFKARYKRAWSTPCLGCSDLPPAPPPTSLNMSINGCGCGIFFPNLAAMIFLISSIFQYFCSFSTIFRNFFAILFLIFYFLSPSPRLNFRPRLNLILLPF